MITALDKNTALILIDLQNAIVSSPSLAHPVTDVLHHVNELIDAFRKKNLPIVIVNVNPKNAAWTKARKEAKPISFSGNDWYKITDKIRANENDIYITKHTWNAFFETQLQEELKKRSVTGIVIGGISTSIGVEGTARAASELGYNLTFATDAMTDMQPLAHERSIQFIFPRMGETGSTKEIIKILEEL